MSKTGTQCKKITQRLIHLEAEMFVDATDEIINKLPNVSLTVSNVQCVHLEFNLFVGWLRVWFILDVRPPWKLVIKLSLDHIFYSTSCRNKNQHTCVYRM